MTQTRNACEGILVNPGNFASLSFEVCDHHEASHLRKNKLASAEG